MTSVLDEGLKITLYLKQENYAKIKLIPKGERTNFFNNAIAKALDEIEAERHAKDFLDAVESFERQKPLEPTIETIRKGREYLTGKHQHENKK